MPTSTLEFVYLGMVDFRKFQAHCKFVSPTSTFEFLFFCYDCMVDFASFNHTGLRRRASASSMRKASRPLTPPHAPSRLTRAA